MSENCIWSKKIVIVIIALAFSIHYSFSQSTGDFRTNGNVNFTSAANWQTYNGSAWVAAAAAPTTTGGVVTISAGNTATVAANTAIKSLIVNETINLNDGVTLTVNGDVTVQATGAFNMPGGSGLATLIVYGNYTNYGISDFWKSTVVVTGNFTSPNTSGVQALGNLIVGGNVVGDIDLTGGSGTNQIYVLNPNATVTITPASISPSTTISSPPESVGLVNIVNTVIYGSPCGFTINGPANTTSCSGSMVNFYITSTTATLPTYQWEENRGLGWSTLSPGGGYSNVTSPTLTITGATAGMSGYIYRCAIKDNSNCIKYSYSATLTVSGSTPPTVPIATGASICGAGTVTLTASGAGAGENYKWFNALTGGTILQTGGATYTTPSISATTTYYVSKYNTAQLCESARVAVTAAVNQLPAFTVTGSTTQICESDPFTLLTTFTSIATPYKIDIKLNGTSVTTPAPSGQTANPYDYSPTVLWSGSVPNKVNNYTVTVTDNNNCIVTSGTVTLTVWKRLQTGPNYHIPNYFGL